MTTPLIQLPLLAFLFLAVRGDWTLLYLIIELIFCLMLIELIAGMWAWHIFAKHQNDLHKLKRQIALQMRNAKQESGNDERAWNVA